MPIKFTFNLKLQTDDSEIFIAHCVKREKVPSLISNSGYSRGRLIYTTLMGIGNLALIGVDNDHDVV